MKKYTPEDKLEILTLFEEGEFSMKEISENFDIPMGTLYRWKSDRPSKIIEDLRSIKSEESSKIIEDLRRELAETRERTEDLRRDLDEILLFVQRQMRSEAKRRDEAGLTGKTIFSKRP